MARPSGVRDGRELFESARYRRNRRGEFSVQTNQHPGAEQVQALASVLYDLRNDLGLSAALRLKQAEKTHLFETHLAVTRRGDVLVCDRAYADYSVMAMLLAGQCHFVIRFLRREFHGSQRVLGVLGAGAGRDVDRACKRPDLCDGAAVAVDLAGAVTQSAAPEWGSGSARHRLA